MLTGDFNCDDGYEQSKPVLYLKGELDSSPITFDDTFRSYNGDSADGTTFPGKPGDTPLAGHNNSRGDTFQARSTT